MSGEDEASEILQKKIGVSAAHPAVTPQTIDRIGAIAGRGSLTNIHLYFGKV
jgi:hypothetical protein